MYYEIAALEKINCEEITTYKLINNYGYKFNKGGYQYTLNHIIKELGDSVDYWQLHFKRFETFEEVIEYLQDL